MALHAAQNLMLVVKLPGIMSRVMNEWPTALTILTLATQLWDRGAHWWDLA